MLLIVFGLSGRRYFFPQCFNLFTVMSLPLSSHPRRRPFVVAAVGLFIVSHSCIYKHTTERKLDFNRNPRSSSAFREMYPRVLECILQTESPELMLSHKDEILETLDMIASDTGKSAPFQHILTARTTRVDDVHGQRTAVAQ